MIIIKLHRKSLELFNSSRLLECEENQALLRTPCGRWIKVQATK
jgi:hypothetical protein